MMDDERQSSLILTQRDFEILLDALQYYVIEFRCETTDERYALITKVKAFIEPEEETGQ
jgi:hypothetical protein